MRLENVLAELRSRADSENVKGMARFGISPKGTLGVTMPVLRGLAKKIGKDHALALKLWDSGIHEARILASLVDDPAQVSVAQMEDWVADFDSWDVCDGCCGNLFDKTGHAYRKAVEWSRRDKEYVRRAGFSMMAELAVHDKGAPDAKFEGFLPAIASGAFDERNYVKKAVNWALRQIGKRNRTLNRKALRVARELLKADSPSARWIASDAIRELEGERVKKKLSGSS